MNAFRNACSAVQLKYETNTVTEKLHHSVNSEIKFKQLQLKKNYQAECFLSFFSVFYDLILNLFLALYSVNILFAKNKELCTMDVWSRSFFI